MDRIAAEEAYACYYDTQRLIIIAMENYSKKIPSDMEFESMIRPLWNSLTEDEKATWYKEAERVFLKKFYSQEHKALEDHRQEERARRKFMKSKRN